MITEIGRRLVTLLRRLTRKLDVGGDRAAAGTASTPKVMSREDQSAIEWYALSGKGLDQAIEAHRRNIPLIGVRGNEHQRFMAEVDNPVPDLGLRLQYRRALTVNLCAINPT